MRVITYKYVFVFCLLLFGFIPINANILCGDANSDGAVNILDITGLINYLFQGGQEPHFYAADVNGDDLINVLDITGLIGFLYLDGSNLNCNNPPYPQMTIIDSSDCLNMGYVNRSVSTPFDSSCVEYVFDDRGTLRLVHRNAGLNCCSIFMADYYFQNGTIAIVEIDSVMGDPCPCLCLFDITYQIDNVPPGAYTIVFVEPLVNPSYMETIEFEVDLTGETSGKYCVFRDEYPWGEW